MTKSGLPSCGGVVAGALLLIAVTPTGCSTTAEPSAPACPTVLAGTSNALDDYFDLFVWQQRTYIAADNLPDWKSPKAHVGRRITAVTCNVGEWSASNGGARVASMPWPDGTATGLAVGTSLYELQGTEPKCALAVRGDQDVRSFVAVDLNASELEPVCT